MAKRKIRGKRPEAKRQGPYLAAAVLCENIIEDTKDHALTAIRIIDTFTVVLPQSTPQDFPSENNRLPIAMSGLLSFKSGGPGEHALRVVMQSPSGSRKNVLDQSLSFSPEPHGGVNVRLNIQIAVKSSGLFWMHVYLDGKRVTSMPFLVSIQREAVPAVSTSGC